MSHFWEFAEGVSRSGRENPNLNFQRSKPASTAAKELYHDRVFVAQIKVPLKPLGPCNGAVDGIQADIYEPRAAFFTASFNALFNDL